MGQASFMQQLKALLHRNWTFKLRNGMTTIQVFRNYHCIFNIYTFLALMLLVGWQEECPTDINKTSAVAEIGDH